MKKIHFKKGVQRLIELLVCMAVVMILTTLDSTWSLTYLKFVGFNLIIIIVGAYLLGTFGTYNPDDEDVDDKWMF